MLPSTSESIYKSEDSKKHLFNVKNSYPVHILNAFQFTIHTELACIPVKTPKNAILGITSWKSIKLYIPKGLDLFVYKS